MKPDLQHRRRFAVLLSTVLLPVVIASCGGGGGDSTPTPPPPRTPDWGTVQNIGFTTDSAALPQIAMDDAGKVVAVWHGTDGDYKHIRANYFNGSSWGEPERLSTYQSGNWAEQPRVAMDGSGNAVAIYHQLDTDNKYYIWANYFNGAAWSDAQQVYGASAHSPDVAMGAASHPIAVWHQYVAQGGGDSTCIYAKQFNGADWETDGAPIGTCSAGNFAYYPRIARAGGGQAMAVWQQGVGGGFTNIWANSFDGAAWGTAALIENINLYDAHAPQIAMNGSGQAMAIWRLSNGTRETVRARYFNGTAWGTEATAIDFSLEGNASNPRVVMDAAGQAIAVWEQLADNGRYFIGANFFDGTSWGTATRISLDPLEIYDARYPQIAMDGSGNAMAIWHLSSGSEKLIVVSYFNGTSWDNAPRNIGSSSPGPAGPQIAMNGAGRAMAVWFNNGNIQARHFD
ncbi:hypothetical protein ACHHRT_05110 [Desulfurivibrio sp. D14AmB]|uniref:hypothetical protein n=1 Tax=Desulfurivibrio sp. D14AmB TaxID=3374370 RepID=UPI00376EE59A